jgi:hypothetical protein
VKVDEGWEIDDRWRLLIKTRHGNGSLQGFDLSAPDIPIRRDPTLSSHFSAFVVWAKP